MEQRINSVWKVNFSVSTRCTEDDQIKCSLQVRFDHVKLYEEPHFCYNTYALLFACSKSYSYLFVYFHT